METALKGIKRRIERRKKLMSEKRKQEALIRRKEAEEKQLIQNKPAHISFNERLEAARKRLGVK